jgi:hypothetical protein
MFGNRLTACRDRQGDQHRDHREKITHQFNRAGKQLRRYGGIHGQFSIEKRNPVGTVGHGYTFSKLEICELRGSLCNHRPKKHSLRARRCVIH